MTNSEIDDRALEGIESLLSLASYEEPRPPSGQVAFEGEVIYPLHHSSCNVSVGGVEVADTSFLDQPAKDI